MTIDVAENREVGDVTTLADSTVMDLISSGLKEGKSADADRGRLLIQCQDRPASVSAISTFLTAAGANIVTLESGGSPPRRSPATTHSSVGDHAQICSVVWLGELSVAALRRNVHPYVPQPAVRPGQSALPV